MYRTPEPVVPVSWAGRAWALPFLTVLAPRSGAHGCGDRPEASDCLGQTGIAAGRALAAGSAALRSPPAALPPRRCSPQFAAAWSWLPGCGGLPACSIRRRGRSVARAYRITTPGASTPAVAQDAAAARR